MESKQRSYPASLWPGDWDEETADEDLWTILAVPALGTRKLESFKVLALPRAAATLTTPSQFSGLPLAQGKERGGPPLPTSPNPVVPAFHPGNRLEHIYFHLFPPGLSLFHTQRLQLPTFMRAPRWTSRYEGATIAFIHPIQDQSASAGARRPLDSPTSRLRRWGDDNRARPPRARVKHFEVGLRLRQPWPLIIFALIVESSCRPASQRHRSACPLVIASRRPLPVCPRAPGMPLDETRSSPPWWPQAENVSPKNRVTALYPRLLVDSWTLFSSLFGRHVLPDLKHLLWWTVDRLHLPLPSPQPRQRAHRHYSRDSLVRLSTPIATYHETCHNCDGASNHPITYCSSDQFFFYNGLLNTTCQHIAVTRRRNSTARRTSISQSHRR